ncbi:MULTISPECIES: biotin transporter BioY [unclassified Herbaspirillum]|uniref:biotin transporter BioY n=1 Tax=unclassified Herbaspirillum TaxID=2624150 RepID=UPI000E2EC967|nr:MULTISPECIES: biotin transporter BioY [unclassified Herbaspirillum]RFB69957.1 biotin transporter BioY [Herbaspirillum sp. 3R-3a1]TFI06976.1 biotin transporter BioY [Herbaspirillum sp. 3R11]TFI12914.1 biotin transporter BioY [Herbaspirillum sp. 3R-11]TFI20127.1 biotin transporter BioY [Herbaspirillum sp. 3C11]
MTTTTGTMTSTRSLSYIALFAAVIAVFGLIPKIDLPFGVPITLQSLGIMLVGCLLGPKRAFYTVGLFLVAVALGLPLLSGGRGGVAVFVAPSAGFLLGWLLGAVVCGMSMRQFMKRMPDAKGKGLLIAAFLSSLIGGIVVMYFFGILGLMLAAHLSATQATLAMLAFVPGDLVKCAVCAILVQSVVRGMPSWRLDRD